MKLRLMAKMDNGKAAPQSLLDNALLETLDPDIIQVLGNGNLIARNTGTGRVKVTLGNLSKIIEVDVVAEAQTTLLYLDLLYKQVSLNLGETATFTFQTGGVQVMSNDNTVSIMAINRNINITGTMSDGSQATNTFLQTNVTFQSDNPLVASVDEAGVITSVGEGVANIEVNINGVTQSLEVTVGPAILDTLELTQSAITLNKGDTVTFNF